MTTLSLTSEQQLIINTVRQFCEREVIPVASELEHRNEYPHELVKQMQKIGLFGLNVPEQYGGGDVDFTTFAMVFEELSRAWLGLAGVIGTHSVLCDVLNLFGTTEQKQKFLPGLASGERRGGICLSETNAGTDLQNISTVAIREGDVYRVNGSKMWITNGRFGNTFLLIAKTNPQAKPAHKGMSAFVIEKGAPGLTVSRDIDKLGYKSVETCELHFQDFPVPAENLIGGVEGEGFKQVMTGLEAERLNVAARGLGIARAAFEEAIRYSQQRSTFGKPICEHQSIQIKLADMATKIEASRLLIYSAAEKRDRGERCDLEAGMAKLFATETAAEVSFEAMRILGGNGYSKDFPVERYYRDAPLVVIGGGTNELQRLIIARRLIEKYRDRSND
ncbi:MAG TPA: acyl-CoA dehydrogenase family protein [Candidatus Angelobacter sp.]|jgi:alkylation response protein AidB-like acyl-CoA dehydrogenase|nr:acyl-CoA dehydrogenase family protein [Candidatus Angelobacter sp.]